MERGHKAKKTKNLKREEKQTLIKHQMNRWINKRCNVAAVLFACLFLNDQDNPTQIVGLHMVKLNQWQSQWHL